MSKTIIGGIDIPEEVKEPTIYRKGKRTIGELMKADIAPVDVTAIAQQRIGIDFSGLSWDKMMKVANLAIEREDQKITLQSSIQEVIEKYSEALVDGGFL